MNSNLILMGLFRHLVDRGFPLGFRDYRDAICALQHGFGTLDRERLLWLCRTLWARTDEEAIWLERLFLEFPKPAQEELARWLPPDRSADGVVAKPAVTPGGTLATRPSTLQEVPELLFQPAGQTGAALPRACLTQALVEEPFVYTPWPLVSLRSLIICWRRFRRAQRAGWSANIDVAGTIQEKCRTGFLRAPVFSALRQNQARVLVLVDASASMSPWTSFFRLLEESLAEGRLGSGRLLYFENVPSGVLFETESFLHPVEVETLLRADPVTPLMVISDAGAARGTRNRKRVEGTRQFLSSVEGWRPVAWVNPMPRARWAGTSAEQIASFSHLSMLELNEEGMLAAIDALRGLKDAA